MSQWWQQPVLGNPLSVYLMFLTVLFAAFLGYFVLIKLLESRWVRRFTDQRQALYQAILKLVRNPLKLVLVTWALWVGLQIFDVPPEAQGVLQNLLLALVAASAGYALTKLIDVLFEYLKAKAAQTESKLDDQLVPVLRNTLKAFTIVVTVLLVVQNWGYNITSLLAGLGLGGLAVALAAQDTLSNVFGAITLFVDRPFHVGEAVTVEGYSGSIEFIGLRSTRIRTFDGTLVTLPNSVVARAKIENLSNRPTRRTNFTIGVTYDTSAEQLERAVELLREVMREHPGTAQYRAYFNSYGDFSLNILVQHWCRYLDYEEYLRCLEEINFEIKRRFEAEGIEFAFPTQTVYLQSAQGAPTAGA